jgi:hypothetical protein
MSEKDGDRLLVNSAREMAANARRMRGHLHESASEIDELIDRPYRLIREGRELIEKYESQVPRN